MKHLLLVAVLVCLSSNARAQWAGKLDLVSLPTIGAWQSVQSVEQAFGVSKRWFHLDTSGQTVLNVGVFGGVSKPLLSEPSAAPHALGGLTFAVPGSTLDWALGTNWGDMWLPRLKTGLLAAYDLSRFKTLHVVPGFVGIGGQWMFGGSFYP